MQSCLIDCGIRYRWDRFEADHSVLSSHSGQTAHHQESSGVVQRKVVELDRVSAKLFASGSSFGELDTRCPLHLAQRTSPC